MIYENTLDYFEVKDLYIKAISGEKICQLINNNQVMNQYVAGWKKGGSFYGPTANQLIEWLHSGYRQPGLVLDPPIDPIRKRRRIRFADEGELQLDLAWSGHDYPFLVWDERDIMPGMKVLIRENFRSDVPVNISIEYNRWILRALIALEESGIDLEVSIFIHNQHCLVGDSGETRHYIRVKKVGEQTDFLSWSPMLSPGGFRHLVFLADIIAADVNKKNIQSSLGNGTNGNEKWDVIFDKEEGELQFKCPYTPRSFPEAEMDLRLRDVLYQAKRAA